MDKEKGMQGRGNPALKTDYIEYSVCKVNHVNSSFLQNLALSYHNYSLHDYS